jgi:DNA-binding CsgD family transcriptional regulator
MAHIHRDGTAARHHLDAAIALARERDDQWALAWALHVLGRVAYFASDTEAARGLATQSLQTARLLGDDWLIAWALHLLGLAAHIGGEYRAAHAYYDEALAIRRRLGYLEGIGICFNIMGITAYRQGDLAASLAYTRDSLQTLRQVGIDWTVHNSLALFATLAAALGRPRLAARLAGTTSAFGESIDVRPIPIIEEVLGPALAAVRQELGSPEYEAAWGAGRAMSLDEAMAEALTLNVPPETAQPDRPDRANPSRQSAPAGLSPREIEVLRLLAAGQTSKEVATTLMLSPRTVERHITHIYAKIGARGRADAAAFALKHGLL